MLLKTAKKIFSFLGFLGLPEHYCKQFLMFVSSTCSESELFKFNPGGHGKEVFLIRRVISSSNFWFSSSFMEEVDPIRLLFSRALLYLGENQKE